LFLGLGYYVNILFNFGRRQMQAVIQGFINHSVPCVAFQSLHSWESTFANIRATKHGAYLQCKVSSAGKLVHHKLPKSDVTLILYWQTKSIWLQFTEFLLKAI